MLYRYINQFLEYCRLADFSVRSIQALTIRLNELANFLKIQRILSVKKITYHHLVDFVADYKNPSIHVRKSRVRTLRQFFHFLTLYQHGGRSGTGDVQGDVQGRTSDYNLICVLYNMKFFCHTKPA